MATLASLVNTFSNFAVREAPGGVAGNVRQGSNSDSSISASPSAAEPVLRALDVPPADDGLYRRANEHFDSLQDDLVRISKSIHSLPELGHQETRTHNTLAKFMESQNGWKVARGAHGMATCMQATFEHRRGGRSLVFIAEMDCLPDGLDHANGHNLSAACAVGMGVALARTLVERDIAGRLIVLACPASGLGGKIALLRNGAFKMADACFAIQPGCFDGHVQQMCSAQCLIEYTGEGGHSATPWTGRNALDAAVLAYSSIGALRQQLPPEVRVSGLISPLSDWQPRRSMSETPPSPTLMAGSPPKRSSSFVNLPTRSSPAQSTTVNMYAAAVVPARSQMHFMLRCGNLSQLRPMQRKLDACFDGAALMTDVSVSKTWTLTIFDLRISKPLAAFYDSTMREALGVPQTADHMPNVSTDLGNVSHEVPCIQPVVDITDGENAMQHTKLFTRLARTQHAHDKCFTASKGLMTSALRMLIDSGFAQAVKIAFEADRRQRKLAGE